jgi:ankyrin repeat protein
MCAARKQADYWWERLRGDADVVRAFIEEKADVDTRVYADTPLQQARGVAVVKLLVLARADVNAVSTTNTFQTPLTQAAHL